MYDEPGSITPSILNATVVRAFGGPRKIHDFHFLSHLVIGRPNGMESRSPVRSANTWAWTTNSTFQAVPALPEFQPMQSAAENRSHVATLTLKITF